MIYKTFEEFNTAKRSTKRAVEFANGYGISAIKIDGNWEIAVLKQGSLCYDTPITGDVIPGLTWKEVVQIAEEIDRLPYFMVDPYMLMKSTYDPQKEGETEGPLTDIGIDV